MEQYPVLSKEQLIRLQAGMVQSGYVRSLAAARKKTQNRKQIKDCVELLYTRFDDFSHGSLEDIYELYLDTDEPVQESRPIDKKVLEMKEEKKTGAGRGKGKSPVKRITSVALEPELYNELEQISLTEERSIGSVIRLAIKAFLENRKGDKTDN